MIPLYSFQPEKGMNAGAFRIHSPLYKLMADLWLTDEWRVVQRALAVREVIVPDTSFWQDNNNTSRKIDFLQMKAAGAQGVIIRAGQGNYVDEDFQDSWRAAKAAGLPRGAYFYYDPRVPPYVQADLFASLFAGDPPELAATMDAEYPIGWGGAYAGWTNLRDFMERMKIKLPGTPKEIYTGYYWWYENVWMKTTSAQLAYFKQYPLHLAWYTNDPMYVKIPLPWTQAEFRWWQYTDQGNGALYGVESATVDLNNFVPGGVDEFKKTYALQTLPPTTPPPAVNESLFNGAARYEQRTLTAPRRITYHLLEVNTAHARFTVTPAKANGLLDPKRTSAFAQEYGVDVAINGDEPSVATATEYKMTRREMSAGVKYGLQTDGATISISKNAPYLIDTHASAFPTFAWNGLSGSKWLVKGGAIGTFANDLPADPRTVLGYTKDGLKMFLLVIDGRGAGGSWGMTLLEAAQLVLSLGAWSAINLDGGGSSTLWVRGKELVNQPSDPAGERYVGNHLGITFDGGTMPIENHYEYMATGDRAIRTGPGATYPRIEAGGVNSTFKVGTKVLGGATPADRVVLDGAGAIAVQGLVGDVWVKVYDNNGKPVDGWTAEIHKGALQLTKKLVEVIPPPTTEPSIFMTHTFTDDLIVTNPDGSIQAYNATFTISNVEYKPKP